MISYTSELATRALGLTPVGSRYAGAPCRCAMCARPIETGDTSTALRVSSSFTNYAALTPSDQVCGYCTATREQPVMRFLQRTLIASDGCYSVAKDDERAWLFLTPPKPPFAVCINQASATATFHLHWRTPVTTDVNLLVVRVGERVLRIRRLRLLDALQTCQEVADILAERASTTKKTPPNIRHHPFISLNRDMDHPNHGALLPKALALKPEYPELIEGLQNLWPGELWALATLAKAKTPTPTQPMRITSIDKSKLN